MHTGWVRIKFGRFGFGRGRFEFLSWHEGCHKSGILRNYLRRERKYVSRIKSINGTRAPRYACVCTTRIFFLSPFTPTEQRFKSTDNSHPSTHFTFYALRTSKLQIMQMVRQLSAVTFNNRKRMSSRALVYNVICIELLLVLPALLVSMCWKLSFLEEERD